MARTFFNTLTYKNMEQQMPSFEVVLADDRHFGFAQFIADEMAASAKARGTGIAKRDPEYIRQKMREGKAVVAFAADGAWAGFCYIETWSHGKFVANSGLIVAPAYRRSGLAKQIKAAIFKLSREKYPDAKIFGLTTGLAVMKINSDLGYEPVTYSELTDDPQFWAGCKSCINYDILTSKDFKNCLCTGMLYDPAEAAEKAKLQMVNTTPTPPPPPNEDEGNGLLDKVRALGQRVRAAFQDTESEQTVGRVRFQWKALF